VHGKDVLEILAHGARRDLALPINVALAIITGAAAGLAHAHERLGADGRPLGIVHRDVSPSNVMVGYEGTVKVVDFGVAKVRFREQTQAGTIMGKMAYLSPEQCRTGIELDHRSDIFSLGIVLYEMLTGTRAFRRDTDYDTLRAVINETPPLPSTLVADLPHGLDDVVMRALEKHPRDRFASINAMTDAIEEVAELHGMSLTAGVLRRYMGDTWGTRPEPWRALDDIELFDEDLMPVDRPSFGMPLDTKADAVPFLQATGLIDLSALFSKTELGSIPRFDAKPPRLPSGTPAGGRKIVRVPALAATDDSGVVVGYQEPPVAHTAIIRVAPVAHAPKRRSRVAIGVALGSAAIVTAYLMSRPPMRSPGAAIAAPPARSEAIVMPSVKPAPPPVVQPAKIIVPEPPEIEIDRALDVARPKPVAEPKPEPITTKPKPATCTDPLECQF